MRKYAPFLTVLAAAAAEPFRHRGRDRDYWNVQDPDQLHGPLRAEPFEALGVACKRTAVRLIRRRLQADAPMRPRAGARGRPGVRASPRGRARAPGAKCNSGICGHGLGAFMAAMNVELDAFADVIDETQLSLELYFYARELNRADHLVLGLAPPGVGLLPPGEADVFAGRA